MTLLPNKNPFWLGGIALCFFISCGQNVISVDPDPTENIQQDPIEPAEDLDTSLHRDSLEQADLDYINILLQSIDINQPGNQAETALHLAAKQGNLELIKVLLAQQADVHAKNIQGQTPLHLAALVGQTEAVQSLLDYQASIEITDYKGKTLYDLTTSAAVKQLLTAHTRRVSLAKLLFQWNYDGIRRRILGSLTAKERGRLRQTCTEMDWKLLQQDALRLQVTPDTLQHIYSYIPLISSNKLAVEEETIPMNPMKKEVSSNSKEASPFGIPKQLYEYLPPISSANLTVEREQEPRSENNYPPFPEHPPYPRDSVEQVRPPDIANQLYDSFIGVKKLAAGTVTIEKPHIGEGAFCKVFRGQWGNKAVALKQIDLNHTAKERRIDLSVVKEVMQWEVTRLSTVSHPNLVQFYGLYQDGHEGYTYMVMEFCEGGTLQDKLERAKWEKVDIPWPQRWQWALQISEALAYLHQEGVLHRDLKAENVLLDKNGRAKLADLGLAQVDALLQETEAKIAVAGLGDRRFRAPELEVRQTSGTKETDIYALGLIFWQIVSGKVPRRIETLASYRKETWRGGKEREPIPDDCPESLKQLILECWTKDPKKRPTAQGVLAKLAALDPELDSYHHQLVTAVQKLEQLVHPKRKEGLAYIPSFVTQRALEESIESYWNWIETAKKRGEVAQNPPLTLSETFKEFIEAPNANTLLLLGDAGLGKTLTTYQWGDQLLNQWWAHINTGAPAPAYFPIFIRLEIPTWSHAGIKGAFQAVASKYNLPKGIQPLVFIDGYDELQQDEEPSNLVEHLGLLGNTKLIVTCRSNTVEKSALETRFGFNKALITRYFLPFSLDQLLEYLQKELSWEETTYQDYKNALAEAETVRTVLRNPFVLHLFRESWETLSKKPLNQLNRWQIYEASMEHSIQAQQALLSSTVQKILQGPYPTLLSSYQAFMSEIAWRAFEQKGITLGWEEAKGLSPWADLSRYIERTSKDEFAQRQAKLAKLDQADEKGKGQLTRRSLLSEVDYVSLNQKRGAQAESELPLKLRGEGNDKQYEYRHKSLFEYGMAKRLLLLQHSPDIIEEGIKLLNSRKIQEEPEVLQFWQEGWKVPSSEGMTGSEALIEPLFALINRSRDEEGIQQASANSATLLARARVIFSGRPLQGVRLPGADLSGALLSHTCLEGAQLPGAHLREAYLGNANLRGANLSSVDFGQYPSLKCKSAVLCLSYNCAGTQLAVGLWNGNIELYDQAEGAYTPLTTLKGHIMGVNSVAYRPDGKQLASGGYDNMVGLWDPHAQQLITLLKGHARVVNSVTYRPDGQQLASGSWDGTVGLWDPQDQQLLAQLKGHSSLVNSVCYRPDGQQLASGSYDKTVCLWDVHHYQLLAQLKGHRGGVLSICYRPDGQQLASGSEDHTVGLWDPHRQQLITQLQGHAGSVLSVSYRPDGQQLVSGSEDHTVGLWDPHRQQPVSLLKGHTGRVLSVAYRPDGQQLTSGSDDHTVCLWDPHRQQLLAQLKGHSGGVNSVCYSPDGQQLASGSEDKTVGLWDLHRQQLITLLKGHTGSVMSVTYRPDGQQLASGSGYPDNAVGLWDLHCQQLISRPKRHIGKVNSVTYCPDGQQLALGSKDNRVGLWDPYHQKIIALLSLLKGHSGSVNSVCYRPDGQQLASGSKDNTVGLWDPHRQQLLTMLKGHSSSVFSVAYRPGGQQLASGSDDNTVGLWDVQAKQLISLLQGHTGRVWSVTYRPDGQQLASGSSDKTVGLWDLNSQQLLTRLKGHSGGVSSVCYRPDGQQLASGSFDHAIFVWAKQDIAGLGQEETWQLIHRFVNGYQLSVPGALLKGATISPSNRALLKQLGAQDDEDVPDHPSLT